MVLSVFLVQARLPGAERHEHRVADDAAPDGAVPIVERLPCDAVKVRGAGDAGLLHELLAAHFLPVYEVVLLFVRAILTDVSGH
ncbi:MAG: hypothetical protein IKS96_07095 [Fibrobacter sp.]|nr:hypothetical protein [Fibrobacter sp.]MBR6449693.1 hypothetical protein [Fibrobacter sp.]